MRAGIVVFSSPAPSQLGLSTNVETAVEFVALLSARADEWESVTFWDSGCGRFFCMSSFPVAFFCFICFFSCLLLHFWSSRALHECTGFLRLNFFHWPSLFLKIFCFLFCSVVFCKLGFRSEEREWGVGSSQILLQCLWKGVFVVVSMPVSFSCQ